MKQIECLLKFVSHKPLIARRDFDVGPVMVNLFCQFIVETFQGKLLPQFSEAAHRSDGTIVSSRGVWPHPVTHKAGPMTAWCGMLNDESDTVCAMAWDAEEAEE